MASDLYLKSVLTVIAACLLWMCVNGAAPAVLAQAKPAEPMRVVLVDERNVPLPVAQGLRVSLGAQAVPVSITDSAVPVRLTTVSRVALTSIERAGSWQPIEVRVLREPPTLMPTP